MGRIFVHIFVSGFLLAGVLFSDAVAAPSKDAASYEGLVRKNLDLRHDLESLQAKYVSLENEREVLILHVKELQGAKQQTEAMIETMKAQIEAIRAEILKDPGLQATVEGLNRKVAELKDEGRALTDQAEQLEKERGRLSSELEALRAQYDKEKAAREKSETKARPEGKDRKGFEKELKSARAEFQEVEDALTAKLEEVQRERASFERENQALERELKRAQDQLREQALAQDAKSSGAQTDQARAQWETSEKNFQRKLLEKDKERAKLDERNRKLEAELEEARLVLAEKQIKLAQRVKETQESEREDLGKSEQRLTQQLKDLGVEKSFLEEKNKALTAALEDAQAQLQAAKQQTADLGDVKNLKSRLKEMNKQMAYLEVDLERVRKEKTRADKKLSELEGRIKEVDRRNKELVEEHKKVSGLLTETEKALKTQVVRAESEKAVLQEKVKEERAERLMAQAKIEDLESRALTAETKLGKLTQRLDERENRAELRESEIVVLKEEKSKLEQKLIKYIEKIVEQRDPEPGFLSDGAGAGHEDRVDLGSYMTPRQARAQSREELKRQKLNLHYNMALAYDRRGMYEMEEREYLKCLKINGEDAHVHYNLGVLYDDRLNEKKKAIEHYSRYIDLRPSGEDIEQVKDWILRAEQDLRLGLQAR